MSCNGCSAACAKVALERFGVTPDAYVVATNLGIEKGHHFEHTKEQVAQVAANAAHALASCGCK
jgi:uncharacterized metal-binding protein